MLCKNCNKKIPVFVTKLIQRIFRGTKLLQKVYQKSYFIVTILHQKSNNFDTVKKITSAQAVKPELRLMLLVFFTSNSYSFHIAGCRNGHNETIGKNELEKLKLGFVYYFISVDC